MTTNNRIRQLRNNQKLSLPQLSEQLEEKVNLKISPDALSKYEREDREPKLETWQKLAEYFNVPISYVMGKTWSYDEIYQMIINTMSIYYLDGETIDSPLNDKAGIDMSFNIDFAKVINGREDVFPKLPAKIINMVGEFQFLKHPELSKNTKLINELSDSLYKIFEPYKEQLVKSSGMLNVPRDDKVDINSPYFYDEKIAINITPWLIGKKNIDGSKSQATNELAKETINNLKKLSKIEIDDDLKKEIKFYLNDF